jgi:pimeloyl-ACP methyl ester carboxylesterase
VTNYIPNPTGSYAVGVQHLFLTNQAKDPLTGSATRAVTVNAFYPTSTTGTSAKYLSDNTSKDTTMAADNAQGFDGTFNYYFSQSSTMYPRIHAIPIQAITNAAPRTDLGKLPVVILSPGFGVGGSFHTAVAQELASQGFVALILSVTWESIATETSSGVAAQNVNAVNNQWQKCLDARVQDMTFVLNQLSSLGANGNIGAIIDTSRVGLAGHSYGGYTAMQIAYSDTRATSVLCLDAPCGWPNTTSSAQNGGLPNKQPVFLLSTPNGVNGDGHASWQGFEAQPHGPFWIAEIAGTLHTALTDLAVVEPNTATFVGTIAPARAVAVTNAYVLDFFDMTLRRGSGTLISGPNSNYSEVTFVLSQPNGN